MCVCGGSKGGKDGAREGGRQIGSVGRGRVEGSGWWRDLKILFLNLFPYPCNILVFTTVNIIFLYIYVILNLF